MFFVLLLPSSCLNEASGDDSSKRNVQVGPTLTIDVALDRHEISPLIYGMNFCDEALAAELALPINRLGGNSTTRYNYIFDTSNKAMDWFFENIPEDNSNPGQLPNGSRVDRIVEQNRQTGTETLLTIPLIGWTPSSRAICCGYSVAKYGPQQDTDPWRPDCGNGVHLDGTNITENDPHDTSIEIDDTFVINWLTHLQNQFGSPTEGGVRYYNLDNEPMLWSDTHRDVHPAPTSYDEMYNRTVQYAAAIKAFDAGALLFGPVLWGWTAYFYSALDWSAGGAWWQDPQDRNAHGGIPFIDWYLQQLKTYEVANGARLLDFMDLHYYPQASGVSLAPAGSTETQALRLRSTRSLWDPSYIDESWIGEPVMLIPRMRNLVDTNYPGTRLAITEYNFGAYEHINGALTQADVLGIFGREKLDCACLWTAPQTDEPISFSFRLYRNYDGFGATFGDTSVQASSQDQNIVAIYAAERSIDGALTIMIVNKTSMVSTSLIEISNFVPAGQIHGYRYSAANLSSIEDLPEMAISNLSFTSELPGQSITLYVLPRDLAQEVPTINYVTFILLFVIIGAILLTAKRPVLKESALID